MKKIVNKSKSGFTLLEVLLAVVILVIASTMIMKGFIAVMIFGRNDRNYAKSGEYNYRRAMNETIIHYATAGNQQTDVIDALQGGVSSTLTADFTDSNHVPSHVEEDDLDLVVDVSLYTDPTSGFTGSVGGDAIDASTVTTNRYAFFYDYADYLGSAAMSDGHIYRYGYMFLTTAQYNALTDATEKAKYRQVLGPDGTPQGYGLYGFYCFNSTHVHVSGGATVPDDCRTHPLSR